MNDDSRATPPKISNTPKANRGSPGFASGHLPLQMVTAAHPLLAQALRPFDPIYVASLIAGLLTVPDLQSNCCRLEALVHLALAAGSGSKKPSNSAVVAWFNELGSGPCGVTEDPAEDGFTAVITSQRGNFRVLQGMWESANFFLQRIVNIVERMPQTGPWFALQESVFALLALSDLVCERANLERNVFGNPRPEVTLPKSIERQFTELRGRVAFTVAELKENGVPVDALEPFFYRDEMRRLIPESSLTHSPLAHHPLLLRDGRLVVAMPTAISVAIRGLVAGGLMANGLTAKFLSALAYEYQVYFRENPPLGIGMGAPIKFEPTDNGLMACCAKELDAGRYLQLIFVLDTLEGFEESAFAGTNPDPNALAADFDKWTDTCLQVATERGNYRGGLTVIVGCGIGRAAYHRLSGKQRGGWRKVYLSAPDLATLSEVDRSAAETLWRILDGEERLRSQGVELFNVSGMLNLVAWVRSLEGHLIDHGQAPVEWGGGRHCRVVIPTDMVRDVRHEVALRLDRHAIQSPEGRWVVVRKTGDSVFAEDRATALYVWADLDNERHLPMVYESATRSWWCEVTRPHEYQRWKIMSTWLPRIAQVVDANLPSMPELVSLRVAFGGYDHPATGQETIPSRDDIEAEIGLAVDAPTRTIAVSTGRLFDLGLAHPANIAEAALVGVIVRGCVQLAGNPTGVDPRDLTAAIVADERMRDCHAFQARHFRDFVANSLTGDPVGIDPIDVATLRIGLGWRVRDRAMGGEVAGQPQCNEFLNALVAHLESELCSELSQFDRTALVTMALRNYELAMVQQGTWRRTASANLALHCDREATLATIAKQEFDNNGVLLASRVLIELAVCECPLTGGIVPGDMDLALLLARLMLVMTLGDWSDAIYHGGMKPSVLVTPLGDVHVETSFLDAVVEPFGHLVNDSILDSSIANYAKNYEAVSVDPATEPTLDAVFLAAWREEKQFDLEALRQFVADVESFAIGRKEAILTVRRSELLQLYSAEDGAAETIVSSLTTKPRPAWREVPPGMLDKDRWPWRFRRRLSLLRRPIVELNASADPILVLAPGLLRDAASYAVENYYRGYFPLVQLDTAAMKAWAGTAADRRGSEFANEVAARLVELGWQAVPEVKVTRILNRGLDRDYGDVDVVAWNARTQRVLLIECKDLHFHKTAGELAEQLGDFRGEVRDGKRDLLRKHLDRCEVLTKHKDAVASHVGLTAAPQIESWMVFRNPVPMLLVWDKFVSQVRVTTLAGLDLL
jgi:hypothetical protein